MGAIVEPERYSGLVRFTRLVDGVIAPILAAAGIILFFFPGDTKQLWAWTIKPTMSALTMGAGYLGGVWFFARAFRDRHPHRVVSGLAAATPFTALLLIATILHWHLFNHHHVSFYAWLVLYAVTPFLLPTLAVANWRAPDHRSELEPRLPPTLRTVLAVVGAVQVLSGLSWFLAPKVAGKHWPWKITPVSLRSISSFVVFTGVMLAWPLIDDRSSAVRFGLESVLIGLTLTGIGALRAHRELVGPRSSVVIYVAALAAIDALVGWSLIRTAKQTTGPPAQP